MISQHDPSSNFSISDFTDNDESQCIMESVTNKKGHSNFQSNKQGSNLQDTQNEIADSYSAWRLRNKMCTKNTEDGQMVKSGHKEQCQNNNLPVNRLGTGSSFSSRYPNYNARDYETDTESENFSFYANQYEDTTSQYLHFVETSLQEKYKSSQKQSLPKKDGMMSNTQYSPSPRLDSEYSRTNRELPLPLELETQQSTNTSLQKSNSPHNYGNTSRTLFSGSQSTPIQQQVLLQQQQTLRANSALNSEPSGTAEKSLQTRMMSSYQGQPVQAKYYHSNNSNNILVQQASPTENAILKQSRGVNGHSTPNCNRNSGLQGSQCFTAGCACEKIRSCNPSIHCNAHQVRNIAQEMCSYNMIHQDCRSHHFSGNFEKNIQELLEKHSKQLNVLETLTVKILQELAINKECRSCMNRKEDLPKSYLHLVDTGTQTASKDYVSIGIVTSPIKSNHCCEKTVPDSEKCIARSSSEVQTNAKSLDIPQPPPQSLENCYMKEVLPCEKGACRENGSAPLFDSQKGRGGINENPEGNAVGWTFYKNVMGEANKLLYEQSTGDRPTVEEVRHATVRNIQNFGIDVREPNKSITEPNPRKVTFDPLCYPQLGMPPVMNTTKSESSLRINALAMKYLEDDQLRELRLTTGRDMTVYNVSTASTNISVATLQYLQRYHLLPHTGLPAGPIMQPAPPPPPTARGNVSVHSPEHVHSEAHVPSRILDITALKQQPKLL